LKSIWEFYEFVEELIPDLREASESAAADRVERAVDSEGVRDGLAFIRNALGPTR
jgi:hypothetical protein